MIRKLEHKDFILHSEFSPSGDQPQAIDSLVKSISHNHKFQTLMGVTGSGKTFTMANVIAKINRPTLVLAHNKTLAAQLYSEFKSFFPENAVHYFVSYYDYYQPEAYIPQSDIYIEKDASVNDQIERLRLAATKALIERDDVLIVASVSCIYGLGQRENYENAIISFRKHDKLELSDFIRKLVENYYERSDFTPEPGKFRVRGDTIDIFPAYNEEDCIRVIFFDDEIEDIKLIHPISGHVLKTVTQASIFPAQHYVTESDAIKKSEPLIREELAKIEQEFIQAGKLVEAQRIKTRTIYDLEMMNEAGYCSGIENYSVYLDGRNHGEPPGTLIDFFPENFLLFVDESHITLPQVRGMFNGDRARKNVLVENGFRLPSCLDNRPLRWDEFEKRICQAVFVSATPADYELEVSGENVVEQIIRPTGIPEPEIEIRPAISQIDDLIARLREITAKNQRALVLTLTKKSSEDLADFLRENKFKVQYIHSELNTFERAELIHDLRIGSVNILVGINLLREGMDLPEVTLVAILDADREGYLRSDRSLIQIMGRAARNIDSKVILYADNLTDSINRAVSEIRRRRDKQLAFNESNGIIPRSISKDITQLLPEELADAFANSHDTHKSNSRKSQTNLENIPVTIKQLESEMWRAVEKLDFELAAVLRDKIQELKSR